MLAASFRKQFPGGAAIHISALNVSDQKVTVLFGPSGAGKTTVLRCLAGLETPDDGVIQFRGETWFNGRAGICVKPAQRRIGFVPQDYALFPHLTIAANIRYGLRGQPAAVTQKRAGDIMEWLGLSELGNRLPGTLSGGQQQRAALARALAREPQLVLLDEPLSAVDLPARQRLRGELRGMLARFHCPVVLVTHDRREAAVLGDDVVVMDGGQVLQQGPVAEVFNQPASVGAARVVGSDTILPCRILQVTDGLATVQVGTAQLLALARHPVTATGPSHVCIRAEDVILTRRVEGQTSARNQLAATIKTVSDEGMLLRFELDCGFPLKALLTRQACADLALQPGDHIVAMIKAPQVHLI